MKRYRIASLIAIIAVLVLLLVPWQAVANRVGAILLRNADDSSAGYAISLKVPSGTWTVSGGVATLPEGDSDGNETEINRLATAVKANSSSPVAGTTGTFSGEVSASGGFSTPRQASDSVSGNKGQSAKWYEDIDDGDSQYTLQITALDGNFTDQISGSTRSSTLNFATTGTISGAIPMATDDSGNATLTAAQQYGYFHWQGDAGTVILAGAVAGMSLCVYSTGANKVMIRPEAADVIVLNGAANSAREAIVSASAAGDFVCLIAKDATNWYTLGRSGTWTAEVP